MNQDIHLSRAGRVTYRNFSRLGYSRLARGVYGHKSDTTNLDEWQTRQAYFLSHVQALMAPYDGHAVLFTPLTIGYSYAGQSINLSSPATVCCADAALCSPSVTSLGWHHLPWLNAGCQSWLVHGRARSHWERAHSDSLTALDPASGGLQLGFPRGPV